jgi:hypothetical protein
MRTVPLPIPSDLDAVAVEITADGQAVVYEPGDDLPAHLAAQPAPVIRAITPGEFRDRFTPAEQAAFAALAFGGDSNAQTILLKLSTILEGGNSWIGGEAMTKAKTSDQPTTTRLLVRTAPAHGEMTRYRAGLRPFGREPVTVEATPAQAEALKADPMLIVTEAE